MSEGREVTKATLRRLRPYRPYALLMLSVLLVAYFPSQPHNGVGLAASDLPGDTTDGGAGGPGVDAGGDSASDPPGDTTDGGAGGPGVDADRDGASASGAVLPGGTAAGGGERGSDTSPDGRTQTTTSRPTGAGVGTPEAFAAADCDAATKRIKISHVYRPPCVVPWPREADNGGSTATGVSATAIKLVHIVGGNAATQRQSDETLRARYQTSLAPYQYFYRLWGRKIDLHLFRSTGTSEVALRADAIAIANMKPFAVTGVLTASPVMQTELANRGIVNVGVAAPVKVSLQLAPYVWGLVTPDQAVQVNAAEYVGHKLLGKPARWAGEATLRTTTRKFALVHPSTMDVKPFVEAFARYGGTLVDTAAYDITNRAASAEQAPTMAERMKSKGATSVIAITDFLFTPPLTAAATNKNFFPEWIMTGFGGQDVATFSRAYDQTQWQRAFGVGTLALGGAAEDRNTPIPPIYFYRWYWGNVDNLDGDFNLYMTWLFTGIHGAGPQLTPQTFRDGLFSLPPSGGAATRGVTSAQLSYGRTVFPWDDYNGNDDFTELYWDASAIGRDPATGEQVPGAYRLLNGGSRSTVGQWASGEPAFFDPQGSVTQYSEYPPNDRPPNYPCTGCPSQQS